MNQKKHQLNCETHGPYDSVNRDSMCPECARLQTTTPPKCTCGVGPSMEAPGHMKHCPVWIQWAHAKITAPPARPATVSEGGLAPDPPTCNCEWRGLDPDKHSTTCPIYLAARAAMLSNRPACDCYSKVEGTHDVTCASIASVLNVSGPLPPLPPPEEDPPPVYGGTVRCTCEAESNIIADHADDCPVYIKAQEIYEHGYPERTPAPPPDRLIDADGPCDCGYLSGARSVCICNQAVHSSIPPRTIPAITLKPEDFGTGSHQQPRPWKVTMDRPGMIRTGHWGDCTIYSTLDNGNPTDGICTCGYGWDHLGRSGGSFEHVYSKERVSDMAADPEAVGDPVELDKMVIEPEAFESGGAVDPPRGEINVEVTESIGDMYITWSADTCERLQELLSNRSIRSCIAISSDHGDPDRIELAEELHKLRRFKAIVHASFDGSCVSTFEGADCRIAGRLSEVAAALEAFRNIKNCTELSDALECTCGSEPPTECPLEAHRP